MYNMNIFIHLCFLGEILAFKFNTIEKENLDLDLKNCLSTLIEKLYPGGKTLHFVIPTEPSWHSDALAHYFFESPKMYAMTTYTMDRPSYDNLFLARACLYLVNTEADLKMGLKHLREDKSKDLCIFWVNFDYGRHDLDGYLKKTIPAWNIGNEHSIVFVTLTDGAVQVFLSSILNTETPGIWNYKKLNICNTKSLMVVPEPMEKAFDYQKPPVIKVIIRPAMLPYVQRKTDNPGGCLEPQINIITKKLNFTPKYNWTITLKELLQEKDEPHLAFTFHAAPTYIHSTTRSLPGSEVVWMVATQYTNSKKNIFASPIKSNVSLHATILVIYIGIMVYFSKDLDKTRIILRLFGIFVGIGVGWFPKEVMFRVLVIIWCFASYIIGQAYFTALTSELSFPVTVEKFQHIQDIMNSGIDIFCKERIKDMLCGLKHEVNVYICKKCVLVKSDWHGNDHAAELHANKTWRTFAFHSSEDLIYNTFASDRIIIVPEPIETWPKLIYSNVGTEFLGSVQQISTALIETGITPYICGQYSFNNVTHPENDPRMLTMSNLNDVSIILYIGWSCSIIVFIIELLVKLAN